MSADDPAVDPSADGAFERELLESARGDRAGDEAVQAAWSRFALALGATATLAGAETMHRVQGPKLGAGGHAALRWIALGALGGGLVTAALVAVLSGRGGSPKSVPSAALSSAPLSSVTRPSPEVAVPSPVALNPKGEEPSARTSPAGERADAQEVTSRPGASTRRGGAPAPASGAVATSRTNARPGTSSSLAAEIALLDAARGASRAGEFERALAILARYRREHARGELRRESDVLTLETLFLRGDHDAATRLARHFLEAFPGDPHAAYVRTFAH
jgi:hypothetical protein